MEHMNRIEELAAEIATFEFLYCDERHESPMRNRDGSAEQSEMGPKLVDQCSIADQRKRPACGHCLDHRSQDPIANIIYELWKAGRITPPLAVLTQQYAVDMARKKPLDKAIRDARTGGAEKAADVPSHSEGEIAAAPLVAEHRRIVDRMRILTAALLEEARSESTVVV